MIAIRRLDADGLARRLPEFAAILHACVAQGASVGFVLPFTPADAAAFWREAVLPPLAANRRVLLAASLDGRLAGTAQLLHDTPPNQPHRAEVAKLLVHPDARRRGVARALMAALEAEAHALGRSLLTLDTRTGDAAEPLYASLGYRTAGVLPGWCRDAATDRLDATTFMYKPL
ncbi:GNAT family N-acetyltransferase [Amaricoccus sp.]|uniref:GNAT family N-acetyltransferase n=1 Tax=Amaricoccus sp. TaxID=1872485 RepID=UPI001B4C3861|nr:GNAT family N-acetyltransferase [Amaricoccus sp.]MBP7002346.1 GNAT family N-acetyltransferase [Amaricoccus sp.]